MPAPPERLSFESRIPKETTMSEWGRCIAGLVVLAMVWCGLAATLAEARPVLFARTPHVSQGKIVFSYHGDIWIANADGANPFRLTAISPATPSRASLPTAGGWPSPAPHGQRRCVG